MFSTISVEWWLDRVNGRDKWTELTFVSLGLLGEFGEVDRIFTSLRHLGG